MTPTFETNGHHHADADRQATTTVARQISVAVPAGIGGVTLAVVLSFLLGWVLRGGTKVRVAQQCQTAADCSKGQSCASGTCVDVANKRATAARDLPMVEVILRAGP